MQTLESQLAKLSVAERDDLSIEVAAILRDVRGHAGQKTGKPEGFSKAHDVSDEARDEKGRWTIVRMDAGGIAGPMVFYGAQHEGKVYLSSHSAPSPSDRVRTYDPKY